MESIVSCPHIVWALDQGEAKCLSASEVLVLMVLSEYANGALTCYPSVATLSRRTRLIERTVRKAIIGLQSSGLIEVTSRVRQTSIFRINRLPEDRVPLEPAPAAEQVVSTAQTEIKLPASLGDKRTVHNSAGSAQMSTTPSPHLDATPSPHLSLVGGTNVHPNPLAERKKASKQAQAASLRENHLAVMTAWNAMATDVGRPRINSITGSRAHRLNARLREHGVDGMLMAIKAVSESGLCRGLKTTWHGADFDWLLDPIKCERAINGFYADQTRPMPPTSNGHPVVRFAGGNL